jgi:hypothetical protein
MQLGVAVNLMCHGPIQTIPPAAYFNNLSKVHALHGLLKFDLLGRRHDAFTGTQ